MNNLTIKIASKTDLSQILNLQKDAYISEAKDAYISEAEIYNDFSIPPLHQTINDLETEFKNNVFLKAETNNKIIGSIRAFEENDVCYIGKLVVRKSHQNNWLGTRLLKEIELQFPYVKEFNLFTGAKSEKNLHIYKKNGYQISAHKKISDTLSIVYLNKTNKIA